MPVREAFADDASFERALRDWFAGQAMAGLLGASIDEEEEYPSDVRRGITDDQRNGGDGMYPITRHFASLAYRYADAMLSARAGGGGSNV